MRNFIVLGHHTVTTPSLSLNDLPGTGGRMDLMTRAVNAGFCISHDIRRYVEVVLVLLGPEDPPKTIRFQGDKLKYLNPDERSTGALIRNALIKYQTEINIGFDKKRQLPMNQENNKSKNNKAQEQISEQSLRTNLAEPHHALNGEINSSPGIYISKHDFEYVLKYYANRSKLIYLTEHGNDIIKYPLPSSEDLTFILSDHVDFSDAELELIKKHTQLELSLGPTVIQTDQCLTIIHNHLDRTNTANHH